MAGLSLFPEQIETDRLLLERLCHDTVDVFEYYGYCSHRGDAIDEVTRYLPWDPHETVQETRTSIDTLERQWGDGERAEYVIRPKADEDGAGVIAGAGGLLVDWEIRTGNPAIWLRKRF